MGDTKLSQNDPRWKNLRIGESNTSVGSNGCFITAICQALMGLFPEREPFTPDRASKAWIYVRQGTDPEPHYLSYSTKFDGFKITRVRASGLNGERKWDDSDTDKVKTLMHQEGKAVCIEVLTKSGGRHWLFARKSFGIGGIKCVDPWRFPADTPAQTWGFMGRYVRPTGYAIINRTI